MSNRCYEVGDRVEYVRKASRINPGSIGTIRAIRGGFDTYEARYGVEWDDHMRGHDLDGKCEYGYGWWVLDKDITLYQEEQFTGKTKAEIIKFIGE